jgi:diguanylate cyclase (GGDEF)-like protein
MEHSSPRLGRFQSRGSVERPVSLWAYAISVLVWLTLCLLGSGILIRQDIHDAESELIRYGNGYAEHLDKKLVSNEIILRGFSALFGSIGRTDPALASRYVKQVTENNPQIFTLEIVEVVDRSRRDSFIAEKRRQGIENFSLKSFSYEADRKWQAVPDKPVYYPIVFAEPMRPGFEELLGLDIDSVPFLQRPMNEALQRRTAIPSPLFRLVEGNLAYVVFSPISLKHWRTGRAPAPDTQLLVDMVIDVANLTDAAKFPAEDGLTVQVFHKAFGPDDPKGRLLLMSGQARGSIETAVFPSFTYEKSLATLGEPFTLLVKRQVGWSDFNIPLLLLLAGLTLVSTLTLVAYLRAQQRGWILRQENQEQLWHLANHDALTHLPNRMLLFDRLDQTLARMQRQGKFLALMFLDVDKFKQVNDRHGHDVGDQALKFVAERLCAAVRVDDTVARIGGDEFVVLIESLESRELPEAVRKKINEQLSEGLLVNGHRVQFGVSIGVAFFPDDGNTPEALLRRADARMYEDKTGRIEGAPA